MGKLPLATGKFGEVSVARDSFTTEVKGMTEILGARSTINYAPECPHLLGNSKCAYAVSLPINCTGTVTSVINNRNFTVSLTGTTGINIATGAFNCGNVGWSTGLNATKGGEIKTHVKNADGSHQFILYLPMERYVRPGDAFAATIGCTHNIDYCISAFANAPNFGGFPHIPGLDQLIQRGKNV